jgi:hypothetical protein
LAPALVPFQALVFTNTLAFVTRSSSRTRPSADRLEEIRHNLVARIAEAEREGWLGEVEGQKSASLEQRRNSPSWTAVHLGMPDISRIVEPTVTGPKPSEDNA